MLKAGRDSRARSGASIGSRREDDREQVVDFAVDRQAGVASRDFVVVALRGDAGAPIDDLAPRTARSQKPRRHGGGGGKESNLPASVLPAKPVLKTGGATGPLPPPGVFLPTSR